jgi:hypothetical protein
MYLDITKIVRAASLRRRLPDAMKIYRPRVASAPHRLLDDPRFAPRARQRLPAAPPDQNGHEMDLHL